MNNQEIPKEKQEDMDQDKHLVNEAGKVGKAQHNFLVES